MIIQLSHFSPFSLASLSLLFRVLFIYFPFIYFLFLFPPVGALLFLQGGAFFLPLHFRRDEWFGLAPVLGGCDGFFFLPRNRKSGWDCAMDVAAAGWLGFV